MKRLKLALLFAIPIALAAAALLYANAQNVPVLEPAGTIASQQKNLIIFTLILSLAVVIPVFIMTAVITWEYRESRNAPYHPDWKGHKGIELIWWIIPSIIILILSVITWRTSHSLDPYRPIVSEKSPITIQVVALEWKWLFIYPDQEIATVNYVEFPENTPVNFEVTADAPMNSLWIPQLGGQIYAMTGMNTKLHLMADRTGTFDGRSANLSGSGFSGMTFKAKSSSEKDFNTWVQNARTSKDTLDWQTYQELSEPSKNNPPLTYWSVEDGLYNKVIAKYADQNEHTPEKPQTEDHNEH